MSLSSYASKLATIEDRKLTIVEFAESSIGLKLKLFPAQKFFLKLLAGEPLDFIKKSIPIKDRFGENVLQEFTEMEYYDYLLNDKRINCKYEDLMNNHKNVINFMFCMGRRASKSNMVSIFVSYKLYELLLHYSPQKYLQKPLSSKIGIVMIGLSGDSSQTLFDTFYGLVRESPFFKKHMKQDPSGSSVCFWSLRDLEQIEKGLTAIRESHTFEVSAEPVSSSARGTSNIFAIFDEFAHFTESKHSTREKPLDKLIYEAVAPSVSSFLDPEGNPYGKIFIISSPNGKNNKFYRDFDSSLKTSIEESYTFVARAPTWEVNNQILPSYLKADYYKDPTSYNQEFGAEFIEGGLNWVKDLSALYYCLDKNRVSSNLICKDLTIPHFIGLDFGLSKDGTAIAICHYEKFYQRIKDSFLDEAFSYNKYLEESLIDGFILDEDIFVIDHLLYLKPGKPPFNNHKVLDINMVIQEIENLFKMFPIHFGIYDQFSGAIINNLLAQKGLDKKIEMVSHTQTINDSQYKLFNQLLLRKKIVFPNNPDFIKEILSLKVDFNANGTISVENKSSHDDMFDAVIRSLFLAHSHSTKPDSLSGIISNKRFLISNPSDITTKGSPLVKRMYDRQLSYGRRR